MITKLRQLLSTEPKKKILIYILGYFGFVFIPFFLLLSLRNGLSAEGIWETCEFSFLMAVFMAPYLAYLELKRERKE